MSTQHTMHTLQKQFDFFQEELFEDNDFVRECLESFDKNVSAIEKQTSLEPRDVEIW